MDCAEPIKLTLADTLLTHLIRARDIAIRARFHSTNTRIEQAIGMVMMEARGFNPEQDDDRCQRRG